MDMKKYNKLFMYPMINGGCVVVTAKNKRHMEKIIKKTTIKYDPKDFVDLGKINQATRRWGIPFKSLIERSGVVYYEDENTIKKIKVR